MQGKSRRGGYHQEDVKHVQGKRRREGYYQEDVKHVQGKIRRSNNIWRDNIRDDVGEYKMTRNMAQN